MKKLIFLLIIIVIVALGATLTYLMHTNSPGDIAVGITKNPFKNIRYKNYKFLSMLLSQAIGRTTADATPFLVAHPDSYILYAFVKGYFKSVEKQKVQKIITVNNDKINKKIVVLLYKKDTVIIVLDKGKMDADETIFFIMADKEPAKYAYEAINLALQNPVYANIKKANEIKKLVSVYKENFEMLLSSESILDENLYKKAENDYKNLSLISKINIPKVHLVGSENSPKMTSEEYEMIKKGMTYEEVVNIVGSKGKRVSIIGKEGEVNCSEVYTWETEGNFTVSIIFTGGIVEEKFKYD